MPILVAAVACTVLVVAQYVLPGQPWYHHGSYAALLVALIGWQWWLVRRYWKYALVAAGAALVALGGLSASLLAPDPQTIVGGPGETVPLSDPPGVVAFPLGRPAAPPSFKRSRRADVSIDASGRRRYLAAYVLWTQPRTSAYVAVFDTHGARLTITQPTNTSFLSPVLLFASTTSIDGRELPVDSFAVPAAHRNVKAVLFTSRDIARIGKLAADGRPGVLFAVEDERGTLIPGAIGMARDGERVRAGGLVLQPSIAPFPSVTIAAIPYVPFVMLGLLVGLLGVFKSRSRSKT